MNTLSLPRQIGIVLVIALVPALAVRAFHAVRSDQSANGLAGGQETVTLAQLAESGAVPILWIDARNEEAFARAHIPGALSLRERNWDEQFAEVVAVWRPGARVVVYCDDRDCNASAAVARRLRRELGIEGVQALSGGWVAWQGAHSP